ncbi:unnamed protein product [Larinioides sclopetarius]|uniref:Uncharacterized protein n=1 Tax=Larinioides sclopetarius TaxID=280406 RepID=A0AAV2AS77_9ARAC
MDQLSSMKYDMAITSYTEGTSIPSAETRLDRSFISEAILKATKYHKKTEQCIKGKEKRFLETIEVKNYVQRNFVSTVVWDATYRPLTFVNGITVRIYPRAIPKETKAIQNVLDVWCKK